MSRPPRPALHHHAENAVDARLVALAVALEPIEHVRIKTNRQLLFLRRPSYRCLLEKCLAEARNVRKSLAFLVTTDFLLTSVSLFSCNPFCSYRQGRQTRHFSRFSRSGLQIANTILLRSLRSLTNCRSLTSCGMTKPWSWSLSLLPGVSITTRRMPGAPSRDRRGARQCGITVIPHAIPLR
jgi:hypothetical protein